MHYLCLLLKLNLFKSALSVSIAFISRHVLLSFSISHYQKASYRVNGKQLSSLPYPKSQNQFSQVTIGRYRSPQFYVDLSKGALSEDLFIRYYINHLQDSTFKTSSPSDHLVQLQLQSLHCSTLYAQCYLTTSMYRSFLLISRRRSTRSDTRLL